MRRMRFHSTCSPGPEAKRHMHSSAVAVLTDHRDVPDMYVTAAAESGQPTGPEATIEHQSREARHTANSVGPAFVKLFKT